MWIATAFPAAGSIDEIDVVESIRFLLEVSYCRYETDDRHRPSWWCVATDLDAYYSQPMHPPSHLLLRRRLVHGRQGPWGHQQSFRLLPSPTASPTVISTPRLTPRPTLRPTKCQRQVPTPAPVSTVQSKSWRLDLIRIVMAMTV
jgi:hypothetical protein